MPTYDRSTHGKSWRDRTQEYANATGGSFEFEIGDDWQVIRGIPTVDVVVYFFVVGDLDTSTVQNPINPPSLSIGAVFEQRRIL